MKFNKIRACIFDIRHKQDIDFYGKSPLKPNKKSVSGAKYSGNGFFIVMHLKEFSSDRFYMGLSEIDKSSQ